MLEELKKKECISNFAKKIGNKNLRKAIQDCRLYYFSPEKEIDFNQYLEITTNIKNSTVIIIDEFTNQESDKNIDTEDKYFVICFKKTIIVIKQPIVSFIVHPLLKIKKEIEFYFLNDAKINFDENIKIEYNELNKNNNENFDDELKNFKNCFHIPRSENALFFKIRKIISPCLSAYFIKESYSKLNIDRIKDFDSNKNKSTYERIINEDDYIELRSIGAGSTFQTCLIYHIEDENLYAIKKKNLTDDKKFKILREREINNYKSKINHPSLPKFYGTTNKDQYLVFEYINGQLLSDTDISKYSEIEIFSIIFQILFVFQYIHENHFIYRDLKPDNIMIDSNKNAVLIDFDRMLEENEINNDEVNRTNNYTNDFASDYAAPEINSGKISNKCDIFSIGKIINFIMNESNFKLYFKQLINLCLNIDPRERPNISELNFCFYFIFIEKIFFNDVIKCNELTSINISMIQYIIENIYFENKCIPKDFNKIVNYLIFAANQNIPEAQNNLGNIYLEGKYISQDINKAIHYLTLAANQNYLEAQNNLGIIYYEGKYISRDINKAIYYLTLASNQNHPKVQYNLGNIYYEGKYISRDINKAIHYFSLAANQNFPQAQFNLGNIYLEGKYISRDINKSIHYFSLAANQNYPKAQFNLGLIYYGGKYISIDINKAIHYFSLAANQNYKEAQNNLGNIYSDGKYISIDINKAIHYYSLAANQNHPEAQYNLGIIYLEGKYISRDINKAIHYLTLASNQNIAQAKFILGIIYLEGKYISRDINKAICYLTLTANQNTSESQYILGCIYYEGKYISRDINKAIYFYSLAANQNFPQAQFNLGTIYYEGKYIPRDANKAIHLLTLAANQNLLKAQNNLGYIYLEGKYISRDIDKAIHYFSLAANKNYPEAQSNLGNIYSDGKYISRDINKAIHYYSLVANQNHPKAQFILGNIYLEGKYISRDINKAIHYYSLAANQNHPEAQFILGIIYFHFFKTQKEINLGIFWILESSQRKNIIACFFIGFLYQEGKYINKDINKSIHNYKEASSFYNQFAKNNLGIIFKHGIDNEIEKNFGNAEIYFTESIKQKNDKVSMYNLAHLYLYEEQTKESIDKSINLLIDSLNLKFYPSAKLLLIVLLKKHDRNFENAKIDLLRRNENAYYLLFKKIDWNQAISLFSDERYFEVIYQHYRSIDFLYNQSLDIIETRHLYDFKKNQNQQIIKKGKGITEDFYSGFGCE